MDSNDIPVSTLEDDDQDLEKGQVVGEYVVEEKIGEGGFGSVFRAVHPVIGKEVAIKVLARKFSVQREMVSRFINEARAVIQIQHRHIIDVFAFGQLDDGRHYYVMELLKGQPLDAYLETKGPLPLPEVISILRPIAKALDAAHRKGIAHRDLKPENVFLTLEQDGEFFPKLLDFGIAKLLGDDVQGHKTATGAPMGTPLYMSPEQCRGREVDHRTDIYAFGILAYEMLTGQPPFDGEDYVEILLKQISEDPDPPSSRTSGLSPRIDQPILRLLAKNQDVRPATLAEAMEAMEAASTVTSDAERIVANESNAGRSTAKLSHPTSVVANSDTVLATPLTNLPRQTRRFPTALVICVALVAAVAFRFIFQEQSVTSIDSDQPTPDTPKYPDKSSLAEASPEALPSEVLPNVNTTVSPTRPVVEITIEGPPAGTEVYGPFGLLGIAPGKVQLPRGEQRIILTFKSDGFQSTSHELAPTTDRLIEVSLIAKLSPKKKKRRQKPRQKQKLNHSDRNKVEDPF